MKSENLNSFNTLSNLVGKGKNLVVQSTRMDFDTNTYISELWRCKAFWQSVALTITLDSEYLGLKT